MHDQNQLNQTSRMLNQSQKCAGVESKHARMMSQNIMHTRLVSKICSTSTWSMQRTTKSVKNRVMTCQMMTKNLLKWNQNMLARHAILMSYKWVYTTHTRSMHKMTKPAMYRGKAGRKVTKIGPESSLKNEDTHAPLIGQ